MCSNFTSLCDWKLKLQALEIYLLCLPTELFSSCYFLQVVVHLKLGSTNFNSPKTLIANRVRTKENEPPESPLSRNKVGETPLNPNLLSQKQRSVEIQVENNVTVKWVFISASGRFAHE